MRVAYVSADPGVPVFGAKGCSIHVQEVLRAMRKRGASIDLFTPRLGGEPSRDLEGIGVYPLSDVSNRDSAERERLCIGLNDELGDLLSLKGPYDLVYERYSLWNSAGMEFAKEAGIPGVLEVNAPLLKEQALHRVLNDEATARQTTVKNLFNATAIIAVSEAVMRYLEEFPGTGPKRWLISNGVDTDRFHPAVPSADPTTDSFRIGFLGSMKSWHGLDILFKAFRLLAGRYPETQLLLVGDGPERKRLKSISERLRLENRVLMTGAVPPDTVPGWLSSMHVAVAPYPATEDFYFSPLKVYEYMAAGRPVVASRVGQLNGLIKEDVNGLLCEPGSPESLKNQLEKLILNPSMAHQLGMAARETVLNGHSWDSKLQKIFETLGIEASADDTRMEVQI